MTCERNTVVGKKFDATLKENINQLTVSAGVSLNPRITFCYGSSTPGGGRFGAINFLYAVARGGRADYSWVSRVPPGVE